MSSSASSSSSSSSVSLIVTPIPRHPALVPQPPTLQNPEYVGRRGCCAPGLIIGKVIKCSPCGRFFPMNKQHFITTACNATAHEGLNCTNLAFHKCFECSRKSSNKTYNKHYSKFRASAGPPNINNQDEEVADIIGDNKVDGTEVVITDAIIGGNQIVDNVTGVVHKDNEDDVNEEYSMNSSSSASVIVPPTPHQNYLPVLVPQPPTPQHPEYVGIRSCCAPKLIIGKVIKCFPCGRFFPMNKQHFSTIACCSNVHKGLNCKNLTFRFCLECSRAYSRQRSKNDSRRRISSNTVSTNNQQETDIPRTADDITVTSDIADNISENEQEVSNVPITATQMPIYDGNKSCFFAEHAQNYLMQCGHCKKLLKMTTENFTTGKCILVAHKGTNCGGLQWAQCRPCSRIHNAIYLTRIRADKREARKRQFELFGSPENGDEEELKEVEALAEEEDPNSELYYTGVTKCVFDELTTGKLLKCTICHEAYPMDAAHFNIMRCIFKGHTADCIGHSWHCCLNCTGQAITTPQAPATIRKRKEPSINSNV